MTERIIPGNESDARQVAAQVVRREARRVRMLAVLTIGLWVLAVLFIPAFVLPILARANRAGDVLMEAGASGQQVSPRQMADAVGGMFKNVVAAIAVAMSLGMLTAMLASVCTVVLALTIRRVTLRQVNDGLAQISAQLRALKPLAPP
jgi:ABC-type Fe3+ transport system permease subunit